MKLAASQQSMILPIMANRRRNGGKGNVAESAKAAAKKISMKIMAQRRNSAPRIAPSRLRRASCAMPA
jgi:hypothetical protein